MRRGRWSAPAPPEADFVVAEGTRLEGDGVEPHVKTHPNDVFFAVADRIERQLPFSAAMLRGGSHEGLKRSDDAEALAAVRGG